MTTIRGAEAIVRTLEEYDTELVVGYIGHTTQEIADTLTYSSSIRAIQPVTELGGAHMINAYNFLRGRSAAARSRPTPLPRSLRSLSCWAFR